MIAQFMRQIAQMMLDVGRQGSPNQTVPATTAAPSSWPTMQARTPSSHATPVSAAVP